MKEKKIKRLLAGILAVTLIITGVGIPLPFSAEASDVWPQKSTAPFYCLDGGKGWKKVDRYDLYKFDTMPSPLTKTQAKRLFWAYPDNWAALKEAAKKYDTDMYRRIASQSSGANTVKYVKDDPSTFFSWVADNPKIEARAIAALEKAAADGLSKGKEAPDGIREATSEDRAVSFQVLPFSDGPGALDTEFVLGKEFIRDIAKIEPQSVWDNGSTGGNEGWLDASQDKNIAKSVMGGNLYEITWSGDSIRIHNNGCALANENALGSSLTDEEKYNKTTVRYKITMRGNSGWYTEGSWNPDYLREWMDFKACINAPDHQRLYKADMRIIPSNMVFYLVVSQDGSDGGSGGGESGEYPEYGVETPTLEFEIYRHKETFSATYNVKMMKQDDETGNPLYGSQFYLYERFDDEGELSEEDGDGKLVKKNLNFTPWNGFQVFAEGTTNAAGEIFHTDTRTYQYEKTYCDGHAAPSWADMPEKESGEDEADLAYEEAREATKDNNRAAAREWMELYEACEEEMEKGSHFHWLADESVYDEVLGVLDDGDAGEVGCITERSSSQRAFEESGCQADCEETYRRFSKLKFSYTWKEIQARVGYILHDLHRDDAPVEVIQTDSSEAGAHAKILDENSRTIKENIWNTGKEAVGESRLSERKLSAVKSSRGWTATASNAKKAVRVQTASDSDEDSTQVLTASDSNAKKATVVQKLFSWLQAILIREDDEEEADDDWGEFAGVGDFDEIFSEAALDGISHLETGDSDRFSHCENPDECGNSWHIYDHRTEGRIHINKKDMELFAKENGEYSAYGDAQGDGSLKGAVYGLFAAEDIIHPDSDVSTNGGQTNSGSIYAKGDLVATAVTDEDGNADFICYTQAPGTGYDYSTGTMYERQFPMMLRWGPGNRYKENAEKNGNCWIGRPLILGNYYIKELSRSEGYELSINGADRELTNRGSDYYPPESMLESHGMALLTMPELSAAMEGDDGRGKGYDEIPFTVNSSETARGEAGGYEILASGFPEGCIFYRVDTGEEEVTGPHVTGTETVPVTDETGKTVWKRAESDTSDLIYKPEYDADGKIVAQEPKSHEEAQSIQAEQIPEKLSMKLEKMELDEEDERFQTGLSEADLSTDSEIYRFLKAQVEEILSQNGYEVPMTADGLCSTEEEAVYSRGVKKGQTDFWGMTTTKGEPAKKTYYGAAVQKIKISANLGDSLTDLMREIFFWYQEHPWWNFGGIDGIKQAEDGYEITLYAGASSVGNRRFFTSKTVNGKKIAEHIYAVYEDSANLRWVYQEYDKTGDFQFTVERQYLMGSGANRRYYLDAELTPAMMPDPAGGLVVMTHRVMEYHKKGEYVIDYLDGDPKNDYRVAQTELKDKIEITTERESVEKDVQLSQVTWDDSTKTYHVFVKAVGKDDFGKSFSDGNRRLTLKFTVKLPKKQVTLTEEDIKKLGNANVRGYKAGDTIGYGEYLIRFSHAQLTASVSAEGDSSDTYVRTKKLIYHGQEKIYEDGDTDVLPVQVLERPIKQRVRIQKRTDDGENIGNFRFRIFLKSNLERLWCGDDGTILWTDKWKNPVNIETFRKNFPGLVQKLYTKGGTRRLLEPVTRKEEDTEETFTGYNYEKFFAAIKTAETDRWKNDGPVKNTSYKPVSTSLFTGIANEINSSKEAAESAKRSDAVRQFAIDWYLKEEMAKQPKIALAYAEQAYDRALFAAIQKAENYLQPFFKYDLGNIYAISWDSEEKGGLDQDPTTLAVKEQTGAAAEAISEYLPYGEYVITEEQPYRAKWLDFKNRHYQVDAPKEIFLPVVGEEEQEDYWYERETSPNELAANDLIRFNEEWDRYQTQKPNEYVIYAHSHDGDFEVYPYGFSTKAAKGHYEPYGNETVAKYYHYRSDSEEEGSFQNVDTMTGEKTAYDGEYAPMLVPWSVKDPIDAKENEDFKWTGYGEKSFSDRKYQAKLRVEKLDLETGEPILHDDAIFGIYSAGRDESEDGEGKVLRYQTDTMISGSKTFLEAMGAKNIRSFTRGGLGAGETYSGTVPAGTPICREEDLISFTNQKELENGIFMQIPTIQTIAQIKGLQAVGYAQTPNPLPAGVYVLAEVKPPAGYVRSGPIAVEIYSDKITYDGVTAAKFYYQGDEKGVHPENTTDTARIYAENTATTVEISKQKTSDSIRSMKISGRVEGSITELSADYGRENLEFAYNHAGKYLGFAWKRGTLELLEQRKKNGEAVEIVYENGIFQGYGYVTERLETAGQENPSVVGATLALYEAIALQKTGDSQDYAFEGLEVLRDRNGNVQDIIVKEGYAGEKIEFLPENSEAVSKETEETESPVWEIRQIRRPDTSVLFYELGNLEVGGREKDGSLFGYDENGQKMKITFDTESVYALRNGIPAFEIHGGDFSKLRYDRKAKAFTAMDSETEIYHLDENLCRDAKVDGYTGLAYIDKTEFNLRGKEEQRYYVWPVTKETDQAGKFIGKRKILTGRPGEMQEGSEKAYITGTWNDETKTFEKRVNPLLDAYGLVESYPESKADYKKGEAVFDRDGDYLTYRYEDLLETKNRAAYKIQEREKLFDVGNPTDVSDDLLLKHRQGEAFLIANVWKSGEKTIQDGAMDEATNGQADRLRRVIPGTYILEELEAPEGYVKTLPMAVRVEETEKIQKNLLTDEKTKVEISKIDGTDSYKKAIEICTPDTDKESGNEDVSETEIELRAAYTGNFVKGAELALYRAKRVMTADTKTYPKGYYLEKTEESPAVWTNEDPVDNHEIFVTGRWMSDEKPKYFEEIPVGDYILEELNAPAGYLPSSMELTVKETAKMQSFCLKDDHIKLEIEKFERHASGEKIPLEASAKAELALFQAVLDENGNPLMENGTYLYQKDKMVDQWTADDLSVYVPAVTDAYEAMFREYGEKFERFSWKTQENGVASVKEASLVETKSTAGGELVTQIWRLPDESLLRVTAAANGNAKNTESGSQTESFEYQFRYKENFCEDNPSMVSYDTRAGLHRIDRIPVGTYVLLETRVPDGYQVRKPMLIQVKESENVLRYEVENQKISKPQEAFGRIQIKKTDADDMDRKLSGAWFEIFCTQTKEKTEIVTGADGMALSPELPIGRKENGSWTLYEYQVREIYPPAGYGRLEDEWRIIFDPAEEKVVQIQELTVVDKQTRAHFSKLDVASGKELAGAKLSLTTEDGKEIASWISTDKPHRIEGKLEAGHTYILTELTAPDGYEIAESIRFTVPENGDMIKIEMTDQRKKEEPETPTEPTTKESEETKETTVPQTPAHPDKPKKPVEAEETIPDRTETKTYGKITAHYERKVEGIQSGKVHQNEKLTVKMPETGDRSHPELVIAGLLTGFFGAAYLNRKRKEVSDKDDEDDTNHSNKNR